MQKTIYTDEHKNLIRKLRSSRLSLSLDQKTVAKLLKKSQSYISKVETGQRRIDIVQLKEFSKIYSKSLDYFIKE